MLELKQWVVNNVIDRSVAAKAEGGGSRQWQRYMSHTVSKNCPTFKLPVTLSNLNRYSKMCTAGKRIKFATNPYDMTHFTSDMLLHYLGKLKIEIFCEQYRVLHRIGSR